MPQAQTFAADPRVLTWARERTGLSTAAAAEALHIPIAELEAIEGGADSRVSLLEHMSTVYRSTEAVRVFDAKVGRKVRRVTARDESEHIVVPGATPAIVLAELFERARAILTDPARRARFDRSGRFALKGRIVCAECGAAMVGHALTSGERRYRYYRCSVGSSGPGETRCTSRYVRANELEREVRDRLANLLSHPRRVLAEVKRASTSTAKVSRTASLRRQVEGVERERARLADRYLHGGFDHATLDTKALALDERGRCARRSAARGVRRQQRQCGERTAEPP